jgi:hypothetical protein
MAGGADRIGANVVKDLFGTQIQEQGRGFYVALELLAIVRGVLEKHEDELLSPEVAQISYRRISHDLARRVATGTTIHADELESAIQGQVTLHTLNALLSSLVVEIPGRRKEPDWIAAHLYPFVGELVHYDAVNRRGHPVIERYMFRDGGGWAYHVLRKDPDQSRRELVRDELMELLRDSDSALGRVASALHSHDYAQVSDFTDESESETVILDGVSPWPDHLRQGVHSIVSRTASPRAKRIEHLMHWVPYCLARHELAVARASLGLQREIVTIDATRDTANQLRVHSQGLLNEFSWNISEALTRRALEMSTADDSADSDERWAKYLEPNAAFTRSPKGFFTGTLGAVGALNAVTGKRHFVFKPALLEALACASLPAGTEVEFNDFCGLLFREYGVVITDRTATQIALTTDIDAGVFAGNALAFKERLTAAGLLTHYSDATSLVHGETR